MRLPISIQRHRCSGTPALERQGNKAPATRHPASKHRKSPARGFASFIVRCLRFIIASPL
eukprot:9732788-Alexandrium_andersonii.AAC.1